MILYTGDASGFSMDNTIQLLTVTVHRLQLQSEVRNLRYLNFNETSRTMHVIKFKPFFEFVILKI